ncbi:MAG: Asp-tRNA(Asn)/Glu-tRNA(Gln) amidotransferase subunit GatB [Actinobacteria bacterium]|nr:MAG: Asp-tRNA(Asn)/Glu-tRNA(Gln) amidotransferase subunit GatB [Actinomycetota bacterium]
MAEWEPVVGLEIHVQLKTRTKMFCRCANAYATEPNTHTCPVCLAFPGALPTPNETAIEWTLKLGLALGCDIAPRALFHRKHYPYPDLPKGYQISQYDEPLCVNGSFVVPGDDGDLEVGIVRAHLEEDAAKTIHVGGATGRIVGAAHSNIDFNRGGTPLVEIVTRPDIHSPEQARRFLQLLRQTIVELGISDAEMEKGQLRADANVSVRERSEAGYRTRTELKNMNSFSHIARGIDAEVRRQIATWESGGQVVQQTLDYEVKSDTVTPRRRKEEADDYRYFPEPDLVPIEPDADLLERLRAELPESPGTRIRALVADVGFDQAVDLVATGNEHKARLLVENGLDWPTAANVAMNQLAAIDPLPENGPALVAIIEQRDAITREALMASFADSAAGPLDAEAVLAEQVVADTSELEPLVERVLADSPGQVAAYKGGKQGLLGYFVGQVMKETQGKADPRVVNELVRTKLG